MRYTEQEDAIIISCIAKDPGNISRAIELAASRLPNRSYESVAARYYNKLKNSSNVIAVASKTGNIMLNKNDKRNNDKLNVIVSLSENLNKQETKSLISTLFKRL